MGVTVLEQVSGGGQTGSDLLVVDNGEGSDFIAGEASSGQRKTDVSSSRASSTGSTYTYDSRGNLTWSTDGWSVNLHLGDENQGDQAAAFHRFTPTDHGPVVVMDAHPHLPDQRPGAYCDR